jgi:hypothetical protein
VARSKLKSNSKQTQIKLKANSNQTQSKLKSNSKQTTTLTAVAATSEIDNTTSDAVFFYLLWTAFV